MKIISKYKDYFDYLAGIYGIDEKLVLDRTEFTPTSDLEDRTKIIFYICGYIIDGYYRDGKFHYCSDIEQFEDKSEKRWRWIREDNKYLVVDDYYRYNYVEFNKTPILDKDNINEKLNCPILMVKSDFKSERRSSSNDNHQFLKFPILKDYDLVSVFSPEKMWTMLYDFLAKTKDIENNQSDKEKIISKGFDYKHSFRNTK